MINENLKRGTIELVILSMLRGGDKYGYQIVQEIFTKSKGVYDLQEGSTYPSLYRLQERGLISDRKELVGKKRTRVYYHLTEAGEKYLEKLIKEYRAVTEGIDLIVKGEPNGQA